MAGKHYYLKFLGRNVGVQGEFLRESDGMYSN